MVPARSHKVPRVSWYSGYCHVIASFAYGAFTLCGRSFQDRSADNQESIMQSEPRHARTSGWALPLSNTRLSLSLAGFPKTNLLAFSSLSQSITPECTHSGLGSFPFARRYSGNRCFFLFLRVLRCFSSPGSPCMAMYSPYSG